MKMNRVWQMPNSETFSIPVIGDFVQRYLADALVSIDPFSRNKRWATHTNDLNPNTAAEHHMDAGEFLKKLADEGVVADLVIIDPPYSPRQVKECYDGIGIAMKKEDALLGAVRGALREQIQRLLSPSGRVLWFGWNTNGMGEKFDFVIEEALLVSHGSDHNDTICMAERRKNIGQGSLFS